MDVWINGEAMVENFHPKGGTLYPGLRSYWKNGYYRDPSIRQSGSVFQDDLRLGRTRQSVELTR